MLYYETTFFMVYVNYQKGVVFLCAKKLLEEFLIEITIKNYSNRTKKSYKNNVSLFLTWLEIEYGVTEIEDIMPAHIKAYMKYQTNKGRKPSYINSILKCLIAYFNYVVDEEYVNINVAKKVRFQREDKALIRAFTDQEVRNMISSFSYKTYMEARNKCIMAVLLDTGIRNAELCGIKVFDIRENNMLIFGKGAKERLVPISPFLKKVMLKYESIRDYYFKEHGQLFEHYFLSYRAKPLTIEAVERVVKIAGERANVRKEIRCSPHTCRHYYAQAQLRNGLDVYSVSRLLGHENITITKRYLQSMQDEQIVERSVKTSPLMNLK